MSLLPTRITPVQRQVERHRAAAANLLSVLSDKAVWMQPALVQQIFAAHGSDGGKLVRAAESIAASAGVQPWGAGVKVEVDQNDNVTVTLPPPAPKKE